MRAAILTKYGGVENFIMSEDSPKPEVTNNQVLIEVKNCSLNPIDLKTREGLLKRIIKLNSPMILGYDIAGTIVEIGKNITEFKVGDRVYGMVDQNKKPSLSGFAKPGAYAQYVVTREDSICLIPDGLDFKQSAVIPMCVLTAYQAINVITQVKKGDRILINGASGGVGVYAVQFAKLLGAHVTTTSSKKHLVDLLELGADEVYDYRSLDIFQSDRKFDLIYDVVSNQSSVKAKGILDREGRYISNLAPLYVFLFPWLRKFRSLKRDTYVWVENNSQHLHHITQLLKDKKLKPVIDSVFPLEEVSRAHEYLEHKSPFGKVCMAI